MIRLSNSDASIEASLTLESINWLPTKALMISMGTPENDRFFLSIDPADFANIMQAVLFNPGEPMEVVAPDYQEEEPQ